MFIKKSKKTILTVFFIVLAVLILTSSWYIKLNLVESVRLTEGESHYVNLPLPFNIYVQADKDGIIELGGEVICSETPRFKIKDQLSLQALSLGEVNLELSLYGIIPLRQVTVNVLPETKITPGGHSIGIKLHDQGVIASGFYAIEQENQSYSPAEEAGVKVGDIIVAINDKQIADINEVSNIMHKMDRPGKVTLTIKRNGQKVEKSVYPAYVEEAESYRLGLYIRDTAAGVGTLSFYEENTGRYGALGHIIMDIETNEPVKINNGQIVNSNIVNIIEAKRGQPGEKTGVFMDDKMILGSIDKNTRYGIFGNMFRIEDYGTPYPDPLPIGTISQVEEGPAEVLTVIDEDKVEAFDIEIESVIAQSSPGDKSMIIHVIDERLLKATGGIVQGMSGSPIIQNGRVIGAVTHVFVNDPTRGYAIFMEWMAKEAGLYD